MLLNTSLLVAPYELQRAQRQYSVYFKMKIYLLLASYSTLPNPSKKICKFANSPDISFRNDWARSLAIMIHFLLTPFGRSYIALAKTDRKAIEITFRIS